MLESCAGSSNFSIAGEVLLKFEGPFFFLIRFLCFCTLSLPSFCFWLGKHIVNLKNGDVGLIEFFEFLNCLITDSKDAPYGFRGASSHI